MMAFGVGLAGLLGAVGGAGLGMSVIADQRFKQQQFDIEQARPGATGMVTGAADSHRADSGKTEAMSAAGNRCLDLLLSPVYPGALSPEHLADLRASGLSDDTIRVQRLMSIPPSMIDRLLGFKTPAVRSAMLIPFAEPRGGWMPHVRIKIFPSYRNKKGRTVKYLGPKGQPPRLFFPRCTLAQVLSDSEQPLWAVEGAKKSLAVSQLGLPSVGFEGIHGWHRRGSHELLEDFDLIPLRDRLIELVPDADVQTNPHVRRGAEALALALARRGARPRLVTLPEAA